MHPRPSLASLLGNRGLACSDLPCTQHKSRAGPTRAVPLRGLSGHGRCSQPPDRRADLALGRPVWSFSQETPGPGPPGHRRRLHSTLLSGPARKPSPRKLQTRRHILPSGDSLHCRHTRGDGHASDLRTAKQCLLYTSLRTKGQSSATSSGSAPNGRRAAVNPQHPGSGAVCLRSLPALSRVEQSLLVVHVVAQCSSHLSL